MNFSQTSGSFAHIDVTLRRSVDESYPVVIGAHLFDEVVDRTCQSDLRDHALAIISDENVFSLMGNDFQQALDRAGRQAQVFTFAAGETNKTRATKERLEDQLIGAGFGRDTCIIALGGGVVTDMAGFVASTFARGVPYINVPTSFLAAADASVGGKTGVDTPAATNLIGAFHQPRAVFIAVDSWRTLSASQVRIGLAETIKHACIADAGLFSYLEEELIESGSSLTQVIADSQFCMQIARRNCEIKRDFVCSDVHESGRRAILNLGHTFGRALEAACHYTISHGEAVAIGLMMQARWGASLGFQTDADVKRLERMLLSVGLPTTLPADIGTEQLLSAMSLDKKVRQRAIHFVFARGIGDYMTFGEQFTRPESYEQLEKVIPAVRG